MLVLRFSRGLTGQFRKLSSTHSTPKQSNGLINKIKSYGELSKFRLSSLVVFTTGAGYAAAGSPMDACTMAAACIGTFFCAASAGTFNQIIEKERDAKMNRTCTRPLPSGRVTPLEAGAWGVGTGAVGTALLLGVTNPTVAALGAFNIFLYSVPYTFSKQSTELNTWIGSLVGAIPPVMGWAAATGGIMAAEPLAIGSLLFLWQFPHFFALSWLHRQDYARGDFQMVAVNDPTGSRSADLIWDYSLMLSALPIITSATGLTSWMFAVEGTVVNAYLLATARAFKNDQTNAKARKIFLTSLWYLPALLAAFVFHSRNWNKSKDQLTEEETNNVAAISETVAEVRDTLKGICPHEILAEGSHSHLCAKISVDQAIEHGADSLAESASKGTELLETVASEVSANLSTSTTNSEKLV